MTQPLTVSEALKIFGYLDDEQVDDDTLKKKYKMLALKFHPDKKGGDDQAFKKINAANECLKKEIEIIGPFKAPLKKLAPQTNIPKRESSFSPQEDINNTFRKFKVPEQVFSHPVPRPRCKIRSAQEELNETFRKYRTRKPTSIQPTQASILFINQFHFLMSFELLMLVIMLQKMQVLLMSQNKKLFEKEYMQKYQFSC